MRIGLIIRPREGMSGLDELRRLVAELRAGGHRVRPRLTFEAGDACRMARRLACTGAEVVVAAGGDGTVNEVVNGVVGTGWSGRLAVVPLGTANDFAAGLGLPSEPGEALRLAVSGEVMEIDVARVNGRHFVNVSTGGFGAVATDQAAAESKRLLGPWAYVVAGVRQFGELRPSRARFETSDAVVYDGEIMFFAVGNAKRTGGGSMLTPRAEFGDGALDVLIVPGMPRLDFLALLPDLRAGTHLENGDIPYFRTERLVVETEEELSVNADGEPMRGRRFAYELAEERLEVVVP